MAIGFVDRNRQRRASDLLPFGEYHPGRLAPDGLAKNRRPARREIGLVDVELVGVDRALDDRLTQAIRRRDEHHLVEARLGVEREHHTRGAEITADHPLHARRQRHIGVRESLMDAIGNRAIVVEAGKYLLYSMKYILQAIDIEKCFLLSSERSLGQVLGRRRRSHCPRGVRHPCAQGSETFANRVLQSRAETSRRQPSPGSRRRRRRARGRRRRRARQVAPRCALRGRCAREIRERQKRLSRSRPGPGCPPGRAG